MEYTERTIKGSGYTVEIDRPYSGSLVPTAFYKKDHRVASMMIEANRSLYMDEVTGAKKNKFDVSKGFVQTLLAVVGEFWMEA